MGGFNAVPHSYGEKRMTVMSAQTLRGKSHPTGYGTFSLSESRESLLCRAEKMKTKSTFSISESRESLLAMPSGENEDEVNIHAHLLTCLSLYVSVSCIHVAFGMAHDARHVGPLELPAALSVSVP